MCVIERVFVKVCATEQRKQQAIRGIGTKHEKDHTRSTHTAFFLPRTWGVTNMKYRLLTSEADSPFDLCAAKKEGTPTGWEEFRIAPREAGL